LYLLEIIIICNKYFLYILGTLFFELGFVLVVIKILENIFESSVVFLHDGVFGGEIERIVSVQSIMEALVSKLSDGGIKIIP
jgi:hypothetical protein